MHSDGMAVRIDSGDLEYLSGEARRMFDEAGLPGVKIYVSSDMDEWIIEHLRNSRAPIDAWGVGTRMVTGWDDPALPGVYKITAIEKGDGYEPRIKISNQPEKVTNPGVKNVLRFYDDDGRMLADLLYLEEEERELMDAVSKGEPVRFNHPSTIMRVSPWPLTRETEKLFAARDEKRKIDRPFSVPDLRYGSTAAGRWRPSTRPTGGFSIRISTKSALPTG